MEKILRIEKMESRFENHISMGNHVYIEQISNIKEKIASITFAGMVFLFFVLSASIVIDFLNFGILLIVILGCLLLLLYRTIMYDIIIPDKLIQIYKKAYYVYGFILIEPSLTERNSAQYYIDEVFLRKEGADDFVLSLMSGVLLEKRVCFKCKTDMDYLHYHRNNVSKTTTLQLEKIWKSHHVQIFCCGCYKKTIRKEKLEKLIKKRK